MQIDTTPNFEREFRRLLKKHRSLVDDMLVLKQQLLDNPQTGTPLGHDCYKIRMAITSKNRGKSGGARVITYVRIVKERIYLVSIYDKSEQEDIESNELDRLLYLIIDEG